MGVLHVGTHFEDKAPLLSFLFLWGRFIVEKWDVTVQHRHLWNGSDYALEQDKINNPSPLYQFLLDAKIWHKQLVLYNPNSFRIFVTQKSFMKRLSLK